MFIVISGGSTTAEYLISMMLEQNHRITIIEEDRETIDHLADTLPPEVLIIEGDGTDSAAATRCQASTTQTSSSRSWATTRRIS